ncbi:MAG TPA: hypothetical protein VNH65_20085 [Candidatus Acidoferrum sp.]|nr:hypothetical protein [Candidatus Acidoferrum sp.]
MNRRLRISGVLVTIGLLVEGLCLMWSRPIAFVVLVVFGGMLIGIGVLFFLLSLASAAPDSAHASGLAPDKRQ